MTGYSIQIGYNSSHSRKEVELAMLECAKEIISDKGRIVKEVLRLEPNIKSRLGPEMGFVGMRVGAHNGDSLEGYEDMYREKSDLTITFREDEDGEKIICQAASGSFGARDIKEAFRRAFCRLMLEAMHKRKMEINVIVS
jgi:hypothetical protein